MESNVTAVVTCNLSHLRDRAREGRCGTLRTTWRAKVTSVQIPSLNLRMRRRLVQYDS